MSGAIMSERIHKEMQALTIEDLYGVINRCKAENSAPSMLIAEWAEYYVDCKFKGQYNA